MQSDPNNPPYPSNTKSSHSSGNLEDILDEYLEELAAGKKPDQQNYLRAHPHLADTLKGVFKTLDFVEATSKTLRAGNLDRGTQLGEFRIVREIARGGMGVVYEAIQTSLGRRVALKVMPSSSLLSATATERFAREAATAGKLHHTNIVPVYAVGEHDGIHYYAMQFIEGRSLSQYIKGLRRREAKPDKAHLKRVARWGRQIAEALQYAHKQGILHRDIKPSNLLLDTHDNVWVTDFGLARVDAMASITVTGDVVGTARYMSPEQAGSGRVVDSRTDIYSLGASLYEMCALVPAVDGESREKVLNSIAASQPRPLRASCPTIPRDLETIIGKCLQKDPDDRYTHAADIAEDLRRFLSAEPILARRTPLLVKTARFARRHRVHVATVAAVVFLTCIAIGLVAKVRRVEGERLLDDAYKAVLFDRDDQSAHRLLDKAESLGVDTAKLHLYRGLIPLLDREPYRAQLHLDRALRRDAGNVETKYALALAYAGQGDFFNSNRILQSLSNTEPPSALAWYLLGLTQSKTTGRSAIESYNQAIRVKPDFTPAISDRAYYRGVRLLTEADSSQLESMLNDLDALVVFRPNDAISYAYRGRGWLFAAAYAAAHEDLRQHTHDWLSKCREDMARAMTIRRADDSTSWLYNGIYLRYVGDYEAATHAFQQAIDIDQKYHRDPHPYRMHEQTAMLYALGKHEEALNQLQPVYEDAPNYCPLAIQKALLLAELGKLDQARSVCSDSLDRQKGNANGLLLSAVVMKLLLDPDAAEASIQTYINNNSQMPNTSPAGASAPSNALLFLSNSIDAQTLIAAAGSDPGARCETTFLAAISTLAEGHRDLALDYLHQCLNTQVLIFTEYRFAQAFVALAETNDNWPAWLNHHEPPPQ